MTANLGGSLGQRYVLAPLVPSLSWTAVVAAAVLYGVGSGAYLSVDYALALDCLPEVGILGHGNWTGHRGISGSDRRKGQSHEPAKGTQLLARTSLASPSFRPEIPRIAFG